MMGSALSYNPINLPKVLSTSTGEERIWYTMNGEKFKIVTDTEVIEDNEPITETKTRYLVQGFELADGGAVHSFNFGDGRVLMPGGEDTLAVPRVQFHIKDHLGNVMVVFEDKDDDNEIDIEDTEEPNEIIERFMYYAFGMQWEGAWMYDEPVDSEENRYRYNGKEYSKGSRLSDYGARYYSSDIGRWNAVDPLAEHPNQISLSTYSYAWNAPNLFIDPDGRCVECEEKNKNPKNGQKHTSSGGTEYTYEDGVWTGDGGDLAEVTVTPPKSDDDTSDENKEGPDLSNTGNILTAGGATYYGLEKVINNSNFWVDAKGNFRSTQLLERGSNGKYVRGVQGLRNSQAAATRAASNYGVAGKAVGGLGIFVTGYQFFDDQISGTEASIDLIMGGIGFTGWGAPVSIIYFGGKFIYEYSSGKTLFKKPGGN